MNAPTAARTIERDMTVPADLDTAYQTVSTPEGWRTWLIEEGEIEPLEDSRFQLNWDIGASVEVTILDRRPNDFVRTEWYAPSEPGKTLVTFTVSSSKEGTLIRLSESGFGEGEDWDRCYAATNEVWDFALGRLDAALG